MTTLMPENERTDLKSSVTDLWPFVCDVYVASVADDTNGGATVVYPDAPERVPCSVLTGRARENNASTGGGSAVAVRQVRVRLPETMLGLAPRSRIVVRHEDGTMVTTYETRSVPVPGVLSVSVDVMDTSEAYPDGYTY